MILCQAMYQQSRFINHYQQRCTVLTKSTSKNTALLTEACRASHIATKGWQARAASHHPQGDAAIEGQTLDLYGLTGTTKRMPLVFEEDARGGLGAGAGFDLQTASTLFWKAVPVSVRSPEREDQTETLTFRILTGVLRSNHNMRVGQQPCIKILASGLKNLCAILLCIAGSAHPHLIRV
jgi:hypothetical protein